MAKQLSKQDIVTRKVVKPWHVSQSVDAFTGTEAYDITISGSLTVTGSVLLNGLSTSSQANVLTFDETTGQLYYTASSAIGGGGSSIDTGSFVTTSSFNSFTGSYNTGSFTGSFTGSLVGTSSYAITASHALNVSVQTSGSSLYSTNPVTSGFSTNNSIFLGANAGYLASNAIYSYFLGQTAGANATNARFSNFFGQSAGQGATNSSGSNFFGAAAGQLASNAAYSNLFGYYVGRNNIGPNNIIIGTNISLPDGRQDSINIGGIIFGTGSYSNISGNSYTGSQSLGRISIAKDNPNSTLDISGSVLVTGSLTISGSSTFTNIGLALFTGSIIMSGSITGSNGVINPLTASYAMTASYSQTASDILVYVKNQTGFNITKGTVVRIANVNNSSDIPRVTTASYENDANSANTLGIATQLITNGSEGYVITEGILTGIDTTNYTGGQLLYLGATGSITGSAPIAPLHTVRLGEVVRDQTNNGSIYVRIDNGTELGELHDVRDTTTTGSYGDLLVKSGSVWVNSRQLTGSYDLVGSLNVTGSINLNNILTLQPADPLPTVVNGSIAFSSSGDFYFASGSAWRKLTL